MKEKSEIRICLGDISFSIIAANHDLITALEKNMILSSCDSKSNFTLRIDYDSSFVSDLRKRTIVQVENKKSWKKIEYGDKTINGYFNWSDSQVHVVFNDKNKHLPVSYLFSLLVSAFYILREDRMLHDEQDNLFLHAAGLVRNDFGYVFTGPSGSGKTTVSQLSQHNTLIINDECIQLKQINGEYWMLNSPLKSTMFRPHKVNKKLKNIFFLTKSSGHSFRKVRGAEAVFKLIDSLVYPSNFSSDLTKAISEKLRLVSNLVNVVPCYEMSFSKDSGFWDEINHLELNISQ